MTKKKRYKRYSPEFKREASMRAGEEGVTEFVSGPSPGKSAFRVWQGLSCKETNFRAVACSTWIYKVWPISPK